LLFRYRMNAKIMTWSSEELYGGGISAHPSVADHSLGGLKALSFTASRMHTHMLRWCMVQV